VAEESFKTPSDWKARYDNENTPWDRGIPHPELAERIARGELAPPFDGARALVPGAGRAHDALALAEAGWRVTAVDFVSELAEEVSAALAPLGGEFVACDALAFEGEPYELVWEHTFLCAIHPEQRAAWGAMMRRNLAPNGRIAAIIFPANKPAENGGPPYGYGVEEMMAALGEEFVLEDSVVLESKLMGRDWMEIFASIKRG
jgi:methyl halide transferase